MSQPTFTPPEIAKRYRVKPERVRHWIESGALRGFSVGDAGRPRYRVTLDALLEFENQRSGKRPEKPKRPAKAAAVTEYF